MAARGKPSRKSIEARLKTLGRELSRLGKKNTLPARLPADATGIDRLAVKLLAIHRQHKLKHAFELLFDLAGEMVAECALARLQETFTDVAAEEIVAHLFAELAAADQPPLAADGRSFRRRIETLLPSVIERLDRRDRIVEERLPPPLRLLASNNAHGATGERRARPAEDVKQAIARNFLSLPELTQRTFILHLVEGKSLPDVAQQLGLSLEAVSRRMREARSSALARLEETGSGETPGAASAPPSEPCEDEHRDEDEGDVPFEGGDA